MINKDKNTSKILRKIAIFIIFLTAETTLFIIEELLLKTAATAFPRLLISIFSSVILFIICYIFTGKLKTIKLLTIILISVSFAFSYYIKWCVFDFIDLQTNYYKPMQEISAYEYYGFYSLDYENLQEFKDSDVWKTLELSELLGTNLQEIEESLETSKTLSAYDYTFSYKKLDKISLLSIICNPSELVNDLSSISKRGVWKISTDSSNKISGNYLILAWVGEFVLMISMSALGTITAFGK